MDTEELEALLQCVQRENKLGKLKQGRDRLGGGKYWLVRVGRGR